MDFVAESGLNDGLALPLALIFTGAALADLGLAVRGDAVEFILKQVGLGVLGGVVFGAAAGWLISVAVKAIRVSDKWLHLAPIAGTLLGYAGSEAIGGNGFDGDSLRYNFRLGTADATSRLGWGSMECPGNQNIKTGVIRTMSVPFRPHRGRLQDVRAHGIIHPGSRGR